MTLSQLLIGIILFQSELEVATISETASYSSGPFSIKYSPDDLPTIQITEQDKLVWFTSLSYNPFVYAEKVNVSYSQVGGDYVIKHDILDTCTELEVIKMGTHPLTNGEKYSQFFISGMLCNKVAMEASFQAVDVMNSDIKVTHLRFNVSMEENSQYNQLRLVYGCEKDEGFYGFGAQYSELNMKGKELPVFLSEQGVGRGLEPLTFILDEVSPAAGGTWFTTYTSVPQYITSYQRSLFLESMEYTVFDLTAEDSVLVKIDSNEISGRIITGSTPLELITSYTALVGRLTPLPKWVGQGVVLGLQGGTASVMNTITNTVERQWGNLSDVAGVWLQDWTGQRNFTGKNDLPRVGLWWNWEVDESHYSNWTHLVSLLGSKGIRTLTYLNPLFTNVSERGTPFHHNYYQEGLEEGYFVRTKDGKVWTGYSRSTLLDLSNPKAYQWMVDIIVKNTLATGVCGWMCDFGESVPLDAIVHGNQTPTEFHSMYPSLWGQVNADAIQKASEQGLRETGSCDPEEVVYFMRSGNGFSPSHTRMFWLGDQMVTWDAHDGLATVVMGMISMGMSGYSLTHSDIGGYTALLKFPLHYVRSKELFLRWCEVAAFSCMYRSHLGTLPTNNWQFDSDEETLTHFFKMAVVFQSWDFYRQDLMKEASELGWPVIRHMLMVYPNNSKVYEEELNQQFMVGNELLVAPVLKAGQDKVHVFLPNNTHWRAVWGKEDTLYTGQDDYVTVAAPIGQPCVLVNPESAVGKKFINNLKARKIITDREIA